jgi:WS/DGAT/MGAT family acyltransferase
MADDLQYADRMSDADALMWTIEKDPLLRSTITAVAVLDRSPDRQVLRDAFDRASRVVPRLRQRVIGNAYSLAPPRWEIDPNFDLDFHVRWTKAAGDGSLRDLLDAAEPVAMQGFDRARPLWEVVVVDGLAEGRAGIVLKLHHSITDGVGAIKIAMHLFDVERDAWRSKGEAPAPPPVHVLGPWSRLLDGVAHERRRQLGVAKRSLATVAGVAARATRDLPGSLRRAAETTASVGRLLAPATEPLSPIMRDRSLSARFDTITVPLDELRAASKRADGKLNDAFVAAVLGGLRRYHDHHGVEVPALRMTMPINLRNEATSDQAGNQFAPARFAVPLDVDDPIERMGVVRDLVRRQRSEPALAMAEPLASVLFRLPASVSTAVFGSLLRGSDFITSNVPGVPIPVFLAGARVESQFAFSPMSGAATNITLVSYTDAVHIGVNRDPAAIPDGDVFHACLEDGFAEIRKLA